MRALGSTTDFWDGTLGSNTLLVARGARRVVGSPTVRRIQLAAAVAASVISAGAPVARASAPELFGFGSEEAGVGGASSARVHDFSAGYYNPAGLVGLRVAEASFGLLGYGSQLKIDGFDKGRAQPITEPIGIVIGAAAPVPLRGIFKDRLYVGMALYVLPDAIVRVIAHSPETPFFPYYDNRSQRLIVLPSLAVRIGWGLSAGLALNYLAGLGGRVEATEGLTRAVEPRVDEAIFSTGRINAGLLWRSPAERFSAALVYRQRFSVPFTTATANRVAGQPLDIAIDAEGLFTPDEIVLGGAARVVPWLLLSLDVTVSLWSAWRGPFVNVTSNLPIVASLSAPPPQLAWRDTVAVRAGGEAVRSLGRDLLGKLRAGYGFETSPIPTDQGGITNLLDGPKHFLSLGAGLRFALGAAALRLDVNGQMHVMQHTTLVKQVAPAGTQPDPAKALRDERPDDPNHPETLGVQVSNPGYPSIGGGGFVWSAGLTLTVER